MKLFLLNEKKWIVNIILIGILIFIPSCSSVDSSDAATKILIKAEDYPLLLEKDLIGYKYTIQDKNLTAYVTFKEDSFYRFIYKIPIIPKIKDKVLYVSKSGKFFTEENFKNPLSIDDIKKLNLIEPYILYCYDNNLLNNYLKNSSLSIKLKSYSVKSIQINSQTSFNDLINKNYYVYVILSDKLVSKFIIYDLAKYLNFFGYNLAVLIPENLKPFTIPTVYTSYWFDFWDKVIKDVYHDFSNILTVLYFDVENLRSIIDIENLFYPILLTVDKEGRILESVIFSEYNQNVEKIIKSLIYSEKDFDKNFVKLSNFMNISVIDPFNKQMKTIREIVKEDKLICVGYIGNTLLYNILNDVNINNIDINLIIIIPSNLYYETGKFNNDVDKLNYKKKNIYLLAYDSSEYLLFIKGIKTIHMPVLIKYDNALSIMNIYNVNSFVEYQNIYSKYKK